MAKKKLFFSVSINLLLVLFIALTCKAKKHKDCLPSSCGDIRNISYPFRLKDDPKKCGDSSYELSCENNRTILNLNSKIYYVREINYSSCLIRVVDPGLDKANLCSFPHNTLESDESYYYSLWYSNNNAIIFISCTAPAKSAFHFNTTICSTEAPSSYSYILNGDVTVAELEDSCSINGVAWVSKEIIITLPDIHAGLSYGFVLDWSSDLDFADWWLLQLAGIASILSMCLAARFLLGFPFFIGLIIYKIRRRHLSIYANIENFLRGPNNLTPIRYSYSKIKKMTNNFKDKLGEGGFGTVFKGKLRSGSLVAVKMLSKSKASGQDFINEVATIGRIHHFNVVKLIGFCFEGSKRALVYEFMPNGSLEKYIFSSEKIPLSCENMFKIALGVAQGINYLHTGCDMQILHFDIKPHNILLDGNFTPKVSDFGLAKLYPTENRIVSLTAARGTLGYMAPELYYKNIGRVSYKADIYSFGMLLMEMAGKRRNLNPQADRSSQIYFPSWVYDQISEGKNIETIEECADEDEKKMVKKLVLVALWCIQMRPSDRPSLSKVIEMLEGDVELIEMPPKPFQALDELFDDGSVSSSVDELV